MHMFYVNKGFDSESELLSEIKNETENIDFETNDKQRNNSLQNE